MQYAQVLQLFQRMESGCPVILFQIAGRVVVDPLTGRGGLPRSTAQFEPFVGTKIERDRSRSCFNLAAAPVRSDYHVISLNCQFAAGILHFSSQSFYRKKVSSFPPSNFRLRMR